MNTDAWTLAHDYARRRGQPHYRAVEYADWYALRHASDPLPYAYTLWTNARSRPLGFVDRGCTVS